MHTGKRQLLLDRLREYASNRSRWTGNYQPKQRHVHGGGSATSGTGLRAHHLVIKRTREMFPDDDNNGPAEYPSKRAAQSIPDRRTAQDVKAGFALVSFQVHVITFCDSPPIGSRLTAFLLIVKHIQLLEFSPSRVQLKAIPKLHTFLPMPPVVKWPIKAGCVDFSSALSQAANGNCKPLNSNVPLRRMEREVCGIKISMDRGFYQIHQGLNDVRCLVESFQRSNPIFPNGRFVLPSVMMPQYTRAESTPTCFTHSDASLAPPAAHGREDGSGSCHLLHSAPVQWETASPPSAALVHQVPPADTGGDSVHESHMLRLKDRTITFNPRTVPSPPVGLSYSRSEISKLFHDWYNSSHIVVGSHGIPICYWDSLYKKRVGIKGNVWTRFRSTWHNWKVSMNWNFVTPRDTCSPVDPRSTSCKNASLTQVRLHSGRSSLTPAESA